jgi:hypothetical protein
MTTKGPQSSHLRALALALGVLALLAGHVVVLHEFSSRVALPAALVAGVIVLVVIKHVGLLGQLYDRLRRRS